MDCANKEILLPNIKAKAMFAYLCLNAPNRVSRKRLNEMLWPSTETSDSLRQILGKLRRALLHLDLTIQNSEDGELFFQGSHIVTDRDAIITDIKNGKIPEILVSRIDASALFLENFDGISTDFDQFLMQERAKTLYLLQRALAQAYESAPETSSFRGDAARAMRNLDRTNEYAARCLMQWFWDTDEPTAAIKVYESLTSDMDAEIGDAEPSKETDQLLARIKLGEHQKSNGGTTGKLLRSPAAPKSTASTATVRQVQKPSVMVRRIVALNDDPRTDRFAAGVTTDLITRLSRYRNLDVISRTSSFSLDRRENDSEAATRVCCRYVVNGQLALSGDRMALTIHLMDAQRDQVLWGERFDQRLNDLFDVEREVEDLATSAMAIHIELAERSAARAQDPSSLDAYSLAVCGWLEDLEDGATGREATVRALDFFNAALVFDQDYSVALAGAARSHTVRWRFDWDKNRSSCMDAAVSHALRAIEADPCDATAHAELGYVSLYRREHDRSIAAYEQALRLNPSNAEIIAFYADALTHNGEPERAIGLFERALRLNPLRPDIYLGNLAGAQFSASKYDDAVSTIRKMRQPLTAQRCLVSSLMLAGREQEALREASVLRASLPDFDVDSWLEAVPDRYPEYTKIFADGLRRAGF